MGNPDMVIPPPTPFELRLMATIVDLLIYKEVAESGIRPTQT